MLYGADTIVRQGRSARLRPIDPDAHLPATRVNPLRRRIIFTGIAGAAALAAVRWLQPMPARSPAVPMPALSADGADIMRALIPALLDGALPAQPEARKASIEETVTAVATALDGLSPAAREELAALFAMLSLAPLRIAFAGIDGAWRDASVSDANAFLVRLQKSRWSVKRTAYDALHQLTFAAWYANPRTWPAIGYPGPPALS